MYQIICPMSRFYEFVSQDLFLNLYLPVSQISFVSVRLLDFQVFLKEDIFSCYNRCFIIKY